jgi:fructose-bisphosphate aldolase, class II
MLVTMHSILNSAKQHNYGVPAPNVWNEASVNAAIAMAERNKSPIILALYPVMADIIEFGKIAVDLAERAAVPVAVHLDHGKTFEDAVKAVRGGLTSIMVDRSTLSFDENVREVKEIVKFAHAVKLTVEAELGHVGQGYEYDTTKNLGLTDPTEAVRFVEETGIDCLAVAVGTSHGVYKGKPELYFDLLSHLKDLIPIPLVLHGCSGTGDDNLKKAIACGITKLNLYTDLSMAGTAALEKYLQDHQVPGIFETSNIMFSGYANKLEHYIRLFGSNNRA